MTDSEQKKQHQELETVRHKFYQFQMRAGAEIEALKKDKEALERQLTVTKAHSKAQSQRVQALQDSLQEKEHNLAISKKEIGGQQTLVKEQQRISALKQRDIEALKKEKKELLGDLEAARAAATIYKDDFERERSDRAKAAGKIDSLERTVVEKARSLAEKFQNEFSELKRRLEKAEEELKVKAAQVKNYKKQVDSLQDELKMSQQTVDTLLKTQEELVLVETLPSADPSDVHTGSKISKFKLGPFGRKSKTKEEQARAKAEEKDKMKAQKLEREKTIRDSKRRRKIDMEKMDEAKLKEYLGNQINRLEQENMTLRNQMECLEATSRCLVEKLHQTEASVVQGSSKSRAQNDYEFLPPAESRKHSKGQGEMKQKGSSKPSAKHPSYTQAMIGHEGVHQSVQHRKSSTDANPMNTQSNADAGGSRPFTNDPRLYSTTDDYVNLPPGPPKSKSRPNALSPVQTPRSRKSPVPTPRSISHDPRRGGGGGGLAAPDPQEQSISMPPMPVRREEEDDGILYGLEEDIHSSAHEVVETGRDERTYTLTSIPFDPFLECLYCNRKFRYGEIQKYRKHVNNCTGSSAV